ncbi:low molecular weight protein arginine phosphatase [Clostridium sp.]|uniref:low molecular weight protein arginine phosphatase n=1 Tax=Clostridium sp. TaxID=1506 RepID=UPI0026DBD3B8|nr:low molecular weight protein arginine phosphatase [Clostridium sp.]MDO5039605.1 low molecular weight protein arginine phosphatase [Clostridium sp.]
MKVLFVCTANTCRSPMAEEIFNKLINSSDIVAQSAGITIVPGSFVTEKSAELIKEELNVDVKDKQAIQLNDSMIKNSDIILTMTNYGRDFIKENYPNYKDKVFSICEYAGVKGEVTDPYGSTISVYQKIYKELEGVMPLLIDKLKKVRSV